MVLLEAMDAGCAVVTPMRKVAPRSSATPASSSRKAIQAGIRAALERLVAEPALAESCRLAACAARRRSPGSASSRGTAPS